MQALRPGVTLRSDQCSLASPLVHPPNSQLAPLSQAVAARELLQAYLLAWIPAEQAVVVIRKASAEPGLRR